MSARSTVYELVQTWNWQYLKRDLNANKLL